MKFFAGLDVSRSKADLCVVDENGKTLLEREIAPLQDIAPVLSSLDQPIELVGLEASSMSFSIMDKLSALGIEAVCIDARHAKAVMSQALNKTDKGDARQIARLTMSNWFKSVHRKSFPARVSNSMLAIRKIHLQKMLSLKSACDDIKRELDLSTEDGALIFPDAVERAAEVTQSGLAEMLSIMEETIARLRENLKRMQQIIEAKVRSDPVCRLIMTVPGVGYLTALSFRSTVDDPRRFRHSRQVSAYFGLTPRRNQSGRVNFQARISKRGDKATRSYLYYAALVTICGKTDSDLQRWARKLRASIGMVRARIAVARKLACIMHRMWVTNRAFIAFKEASGRPP